MDNFFALIIGVGGADIPETLHDAKSIRDVLISKGAYNTNNTIFLTEEKSTKDNIVNSFEELIKKTEETEDATVFIYYSGHGQRYKTPRNEFEYYLKTYGADENDKEKTMLNGDIFSEKVEKLKANRILVMLDCCYAGGMKTEGLKLKGEEEFLYSNKALQEKLKSGKGRVFISSCDDNETSVILPGSKNSLFTEVALEALKGLISPPDEEYVSVIDLIHHVIKTVPKRIKKHNHKQNPVLSDVKDLNNEYSVCKNGNWQIPMSTLSIYPNQLEIESYKFNDNLTTFNDLDSLDKDIVNSFFKQINLKNKITNEFKIGFIKEVGGIENFKVINGKINDIALNETIQDFNVIDIENILNIVNKKKQISAKLKLINNYKYKI